MLRHKLSGVGAAMITPFTADSRVDYKALARMIDYVIDGGVDYIVALGTTAETPTLYMPERAVIAMQRILDNRPEGFLVLSGDDGMAIELMRRGGDGVISVAANAFPQRFMECVNHAKAGDFDAAEKAYAALDEAVHALFEEGNPVGVKCALSVMGRIGDTMRLPLVAGSGKLRAKFEELIARYDLR